ncbi:glyoxalase [Stagnihabitans tardus]|uniref:Glyoxalase n=1 Tax=Stagnihabitans tardus TaxID=2699202 RepID=A0AAE4YBB2_9RHOB|nr:glyoxalase [Stagnihabitans tardus]NBZ89547.1 glyoxalase [Stagnihabitans tardus]
MDYETVEAATFGQALSGITLNLLCRDVAREVAFLTQVLGLKAHRVSRDFAIVTHGAAVLQLHSDGSFAAHPLYALLPEAGPRGSGAEIRLHGIDPDGAAARAEAFAEATLLAGATDKQGHGLREAVILCPEGYAFVPSVALQPSVRD